MTSDISSKDLKAARLAFARISAHAWGLALGVLAGIGLFLATAILIIQGGPNPGRHLSLLGEYFPGYEVTWLGACLGFVYALLVGYVAGLMVGLLYNRILARL
jgi:hypothetical protein